VIRPAPVPRDAGSDHDQGSAILA